MSVDSDVVSVIGTLSNGNSIHLKLRKIDSEPQTEPVEGVVLPGCAAILT